MKLVIVESPAKAKTIKKYLGKGYDVIASRGHIADLPKSTIGIDFDNKFKPTYEIKNPKALKEIKKNFKGSEELLLAMDPDREGEAIAWHIARQLKLIKDSGKIVTNKTHLSRIVFSEITQSAVQEALKNPRNIDIDLVNAQQARRVLDRIVGYKLSPLLWKKLMFGLSAGRVQSVALRLIVDKETERDKFHSIEYWNFFSYLDKKKKVKDIAIQINTDFNKDVNKDKNIKDAVIDLPQMDPELLKFNLTKILNKKAELKNEGQIKEIIEKVKNAKWIIKDIRSSRSERNPNPPYNTSLLQQAAANRFGYSASRTMKVAQQLYESGLISYMRTDSFNLSSQSVGMIRKYVINKLGADYLPKDPRYYKTKSKVAQEAHEAIRPTDFTRSPESLKINPDQKKLYEMIWRRTIASQMANAQLENSIVTIDIKDYTFEISGQKVLFEGFLAINSDKVKEFFMPKLNIGQELFLDTIEVDQKFTDPPARYTEGSLIKALEAYGIGRPSTYAPIITTIISRKYIEKDGKSLFPTLIGKALTKLLVDHFTKILDIKFTANMEDELDKVAEGKQDWIKLLTLFYKDFSKDLIKGEKKINKNDYVILGKSNEPCPECGKKMEIKLGRFSPFLSCKDFPKCKGIKALVDKDHPQIDIESEDFKKKYKTVPKTEDGRNYALKKSRFGYFWAHPDYPKTKDIKPLEVNDQINLELFGNPPKSLDEKVMILQRGRFGYFWSHPEYPAKKEIKKIDNKLLNEKRKDLGLL